jgi:hypothetical protein
MHAGGESRGPLPEPTAVAPISYRDSCKSEVRSEERIAEFEAEFDDLDWMRRGAS